MVARRVSFCRNAWAAVAASWIGSFPGLCADLLTNASQSKTTGRESSEGGQERHAVWSSEPAT